MSVKVTAVVRTAKILKPFSIEQRTGRNGAFQSKMVMFSAASDREYKQTVENEDGSLSQVRKTDFFACRATGPVADLFNQYCSATKKDENGKDKLVSRRLLIEGHLEKYKATRTETIVFTDTDGTQKQIEANLPEEREIIVVESIQFLDANPVNKANNANAPVAVAQATPVAVPVAQPTADEAAPF